MTQTAELTPSNNQAGDHFGYSVAIDGNTIVVGASNATDDAGSVYVFVKPTGGWRNNTQTVVLTASTAASIGYQVAVNGNTVVKGSVFNSGQS
jgi:hypothetical protein